MDELSDFDSIFKSYYVPLCSFAYSLINDWEASRDIVSDAFEYIWNNFEKLRKSTVKSYLFVYVRNRSVDHLRHNGIKNQYADLFLKIEERYSFMDFQEQDERMKKVKRAINTLPPKTRYVLEECYYQEKKYKEVAEEMGVSIAAIHKHIVKALKIIRENISKTE